MIFDMQPIEIAILVPLLLLSLTVHEWAHGKVAFLNGDPTATEAGRLTLNPLKHIDPAGLLILLMVGVGWAKPVPVDTRRLRRPRRDLILVSLAGPGANLIIALLFASLARGYRFLVEAGSIAYWPPLFHVMIILTVINGMLFFFNMLPFSPLDGSKVVGMLLSRTNPRAAGLYFRYSSYLLLGVLVLQIGFDIPVIPFRLVNNAILGFIGG
ncbi:MAG: site-2 protease family protein [Sediminispirochaetaceae bacterium]